MSLHFVEIGGWGVRWLQSSIVCEDILHLNICSIKFLRIFCSNNTVSAAVKVKNLLKNLLKTNPKSTTINEAHELEIIVEKKKNFHYTIL